MSDIINVVAYDVFSEQSIDCGSIEIDPDTDDEVAILVAKGLAYDHVCRVGQVRLTAIRETEFDHRIILCQ